MGGGEYIYIYIYIYIGKAVSAGAINSKDNTQPLLKNNEMK